MGDKALLEQWIPQVIMPKKDKRNQTEKAVESNINELEHRGLDRTQETSNGMWSCHYCLQPA